MTQDKKALVWNGTLLTCSCRARINRDRLFWVTGPLVQKAVALRVQGLGKFGLLKPVPWILKSSRRVKKCILVAL